MAALGRILQVVGWGWLAYSFFGPMFDLPRLDLFPGIVIVFIARVVRAQAARREPADEDANLEDLARQGTRSQPERPVRETPRADVPATPVEVRKKPTPRPVEKPTPPSAAERDEMLEKILLSGERVADDAAPSEMIPTDETPAKMSSAEMIAQARQRWNKRP